jgi:drug/metabolite transporter (DMT)-like permease
MTNTINYRLGSFYSLVTAFLFATQEPLSFLAAKRLSPIHFVFLTQIALLISIPLLTLRPTSGRDFLRLLRTPANYGKLAAVLAVGLTGLLLYNAGLSHAHPIIIAAILNLSPFWAALAALTISKVPIPVSPLVFFGCFVGAFSGAMLVAWSQVGEAGEQMSGELLESFREGSWVYALPVPLCSALGGTLLVKWFGAYEESAAVAANFFAANLVLIPSTLFLMHQRSELHVDGQFTAIALMLAGTIIAGSVGRVFYQVALTTTGADNGFVSMFFNLVPALTALISLFLSRWIADLHFVFDPAFFFGLTLIAASLLIFSWESWRHPARSP